MKEILACIALGTLTLIVLFISAIVNWKIESDDNNITALANNCYFEARNSTVEDMIATMVVVMNRGESSVEVYKPGQFSWTQEYKEPADNAAYRKCKALAELVYNNHSLFKSPKICKHYTAEWKEFGNGHWTKSFKSRTKIGKHWYYC